MHESYNQAPPVVQDIGMSMDELVGEMGCTYSLLGMASSHVEMIGRNLQEPAQVDSAAYKVDELDYLLIAISQRLKMERTLAIAIKEKGDAEYEASPEGQAAIARIRAEGSIPPQRGTTAEAAQRAGKPLPTPAEVAQIQADQIDRALADIAGANKGSGASFHAALANMEAHLTHEQAKGITEQEMEARSERTIVHAIVLASKVPPTLPDFMRKLKLLADFWGANGMPEQMSTIERDIQALIDA